MNNLGPCLCGDPYCPYCGDPGAAKFEEFIDDLTDKLKKYDEIECRLFVKVGLAVVEAMRETSKENRDDFISEVLGERP